MAKATIGGVDYAIRPFKLRELRLAAPAMERVNARIRDGSVKTNAGSLEAAFDLLTVLAVGMDGVTPEQLEAQASVDDIVALWGVFAEVQREAGMKSSGEAKPAKAPADDNPSPTASDASSPKSEPDTASQTGIE